MKYDKKKIKINKKTCTYPCQYHDKLLLIIWNVSEYAHFLINWRIIFIRQTKQKKTEPQIANTIVANVPNTYFSLKNWLRFLLTLMQLTAPHVLPDGECKMFFFCSPTLFITIFLRSVLSSFTYEEVNEAYTDIDQCYIEKLRKFSTKYVYTRRSLTNTNVAICGSIVCMIDANTLKPILRRILCSCWITKITVPKPFYDHRWIHSECYIYYQ